MLSTGNSSTVPCGKSSGSISLGILACDELLSDRALLETELLETELLETALEDTTGVLLPPPPLPPPHPIKPISNRPVLNNWPTDLRTDDLITDIKTPALLLLEIPSQANKRLAWSFNQPTKSGWPFVR